MNPQDKPKKINTTVPESLHRQLRIACKAQKIRVQEAYKLSIQYWLKSGEEKRAILTTEGYDIADISIMLRFQAIYARNRALVREALDFLDKYTRER